VVGVAVVELGAVLGCAVVVVGVGVVCAHPAVTIATANTASTALTTTILTVFGCIIRHLSADRRLLTAKARHPSGHWSILIPTTSTDRHRRT
jgi:hypothetical protein